MLLKRLLFFGGKGGVGKSTLSCATALRLSEKGRTLLLSVDPAHSLTGILGQSIGPKLRKLEENFHAIELSAENLVEEYAKRVLTALGELLPSFSQGLLEYASYLKHSPTALDTAVLDKLVDFCQEYQYVVVDSAPTGQMLRLFETSHAVSAWVEHLRKLAKERNKVERFMGRQDRILSLIESRKEKLKTLESILKEKTVIFAIANEEPLSLQEMEAIRERLKAFRVYPVINRWKTLNFQGIKVQEVEKPYGVERLKKLNLEDLLKLLEN
ncbi:MAG: TRC40/GET3/ArsA family transport-energizing ATPase [Aquificaceae bacterium]|nr:TRC40/GET3/ArsA family transport-energizing ATPase [Aquificaceae bacterium]